MSADQCPPLHRSSDQVLADLRSCVQFDFPPTILPFCALRGRTWESFLQQEWQFRVHSEMNNLARTAKTVLHKEDLKVAELVLSGSAKCLRGQAINAVTGDHGSGNRSAVAATS